MAYLNLREKGPDCWRRNASRIFQPIGSFATKLCLSSLLILTLILSTARPASAQGSFYNPGDAIVTGFSGITQSETAAASQSPLDQFMIDQQAASLKIFPLQGLGSAASDQLVQVEPIFSINAGQIGQVFSIALQPQTSTGGAPNIYTAATSLFGLQIVEQTADGQLRRLKKGTAGAEWMPGQFGTGLGGEPGSIYKIDGSTGEVTLFATIPNNAGPGIGDITFDETSGFFFASDLDTGLIHRIGQDGSLNDAFDHGIAARTAIGQTPVADNAEALNLFSPDFNVEESETWGYTQNERRVWALKTYDGRLYYSVSSTAPEIWSVGIGANGTFSDDSKKEIDLSSLETPGPITDLLFDESGNMVLAQRGATKGSYSYSEFTESGNTSILRFSKDPNSPTGWQLEPEELSIGLSEEQRYADGGVAIGYGHDASGALQPTSCNAATWATGSKLRSSEQGGAPSDEDGDVHGIQGVMLQEATSYFIDYDGQFFDAGKSGHLGDVEIWHSCSGTPITAVPEEPQINCPPGYVFDGASCVRNVTRPVETVCPAGMDRVDGWRAGELRANGWRVIKIAKNHWCGRPGEIIEPEVPCPVSMSEIPVDEVPYFESEGWIVVRLEGTNKWCGRPGPPPPPPVQCDPPSIQVDEFDVDDRIAQGWTVVQKGPIWCGRPPITIDPSPCPPGFIRVNGICIPVIQTCPPGSVGTWPNCLKLCPPGSIGVWPGCLKKCPPGKVGIWPACVPKPKCPPGKVYKNGKCVPIIKKCPPGKIGVWPVCLPKPKCPPGKVYKNGKCVIIGKCPPGKIGVWPACIPKPKCPPGKIMKNGKCVPIIKKCPPGKIGVWPACVPKPKCPIGKVYKNGKCVPLIKCPIGKIYKNGKCVPLIKCPIGKVYKNGKCVPLIKCPIGKIYKNGKCVPLIKCPIGKIYKNGKCVPLIKCPIGKVYKNGKCVPLIKCPIGKVYKNGKCVPLIKCPIGKVYKNGKCVPLIKCPIGKVYKNGKCVPLIKCPIGKVYKNGKCVPLIKCKIGWIYKNGKCQPIIKKPKCKIGWIYKNGKCQPIIKKPKCKIGWIYKNGKCQPIIKKPKCKIGWVFKNGKCQPLIKKPKCKIGWVFKNGKCQPLIKKPKCKIGWVFKNGKCQPLIKKPKCKIGWVFKNGKCQPLIKKPKCKIGQVFKNGKCQPLIKFKQN